MLNRVNMNIISNFNSKEIFFLVYLIGINIIAFILFGIDKRKAVNNSWRINEFLLLGICALGGATGGLIGMVIFKHKLSKIKFYLGVPFLLILNKFVQLNIFNYMKK